MPEQAALTFIEALRGLEQTRAVEPLIALYAEESSVGNVLHPDHFQGPDGARRFWTEYRGTFETLESTFQNIIVTEDRAALEWATTGTTTDGAPVRYSGVTILEFNDGKITRSTAYFDPVRLGHQSAAEQ
jgi:ketosteroid isomerase-like protein